MNPMIAPVNPYPAAPAPAPKPPTRFLLRYGIPICQDCQFAAMYCTCASRPPDAPSNDAAESSLAQRVKDCGR